MKNQWFKRFLLLFMVSVSGWGYGNIIHVAIDAENPPYEFLDSNGDISGFVPDLLTEIGKISGLTFKFYPLSRQRAVTALESGKIDIMNMIRTVKRAGEFELSQPHSNITQALFRHQDTRNLSGLVSLPGRSVAVQKYDVPYDTLINRTDLTTVPVKNRSAGFLLLNAGKVDAFITAEYRGKQIIRESELNNIAFVQGNLFPQQYCFAAKKGNASLIALLNEKLADIKASGKYAKILNKWFVVHENWFNSNRGKILLVVLIIVVLPVVLLLWSLSLRRIVRLKTEELINKHKDWQDTEELYRTVAETASDGIITIDKNSIIRSVNNSVGTILGYSPDELINKPLTLLMPEEYKEAHLHSLQHYLDTGIRHISWQNVEVPGLHKNGKIIPLEVSFGMFEKDKQPFFAGIFRDISLRKLTDDKLQKVSEFNASIIKSAPIGIVTLSKEGKVTSANPAFVKMMGSPDLEETLKLDVDILPIQQAGLTKKIKESFHSGIPFEISRVPYTSYWGAELIINVKCVPQIVKDNTTSGMVILIQDISDNVKSEQALSESEAKYRSLFEHSTDAIFIATLDGDFIDINQAFISLTGYSKSELIHSNARILYADDTERKQYLKELKKKKSLINKEIQVKRKDKSIIPCTISISIQCNESTNQYTYQGILRDISEQRKTDEIWKTLRSLSQKLTTPLGLNKMGPIIAKDIYSIFDYDSFSLDIIDEEKELAIGLYNEDTPIHEDTPVPVPAISVSLAHLERMGILSGESQLINRPDDHTTDFTVPFGFTDQLSSSLMYVPISWEDKIVGVLSVQSYVKNKYTTKDLEILQIFAGHIGGALVRIRQNEELGKALKLAKEGERVKSLFLANMSHEIRTPLNAILGFNELIKQSFEDIATAEQLEFFEMMDNSGNRLLRTIHEILDISSLEANTITLKKEIVNINKCIIAVVTELDGFALQKQLTIECQFEAEEIVSFVDPYYVQQALSNILDNAIKYTHEGNILFLLKENRELIIRDTGIGIAEDYIRHVFDLFSQESEGYTKEYQGIGLGLALTKKYLELNDVKIDVKSKKDIGTEFVLQFPPVSEA